MLLSEVQANLMFGNFRQGQRYKVDIHDPTVAGLIKAGYLKIIWKGREDAADTWDPDRAGDFPGADMAGPLALSAQADPEESKAAPRSSSKKTAVSDGADQLEPSEGDLLSA